MFILQRPNQVAPPAKMQQTLVMIHRPCRTLSAICRPCRGRPNTGDKLRASNMLNARLLHPLVRRRHDSPDQLLLRGLVLLDQGSAELLTNSRRHCSQPCRTREKQQPEQHSRDAGHCSRLPLFVPQQSLVTLIGSHAPRPKTPAEEAPCTDRRRDTRRPPGTAENRRESRRQLGTLAPYAGSRLRPHRPCLPETPETQTS